MDYKIFIKENYSFKNQIEILVSKSKNGWEKLSKQEKYNLCISYLIDEFDHNSMDITFDKHELILLLIFNHEPKDYCNAIMESIEQLFSEDIDQALIDAYFKYIEGTKENNAFDDFRNEVAQVELAYFTKED